MGERTSRFRGTSDSRSISCRRNHDAALDRLSKERTGHGRKWRSRLCAWRVRDVRNRCSRLCSYTGVLQRCGSEKRKKRKCLGECCRSGVTQGPQRRRSHTLRGGVMKERDMTERMAGKHAFRRDQKDNLRQGGRCCDQQDRRDGHHIQRGVCGTLIKKKKLSRRPRLFRLSSLNHEAGGACTG